MKVLVVGASRGSGNQVVRELAAAGHDVTAFARTASAADYGDAAVRRVDGDVMSPADVEKAVIGQDAVVVTLGISDNPLKVQWLHRASTPLRVRSDGTREVVGAMQRQGVTRLVVESMYGLGDTYRNLPISLKVFLSFVIKRQVEDSERQEDVVRGSGLDWTLIRPVVLHDGEETEAARVSANDEFDGLKVSRRQVARAIAETLGRSDAAHATLTVSGR
ncbi:uncharacterized protein YbjT (DUF2867 family) [Nocardioides thalensis]|uniref:Uncharacterized protein YbjT (DUF2867 family) n=1 Tax=Nocardioides thalensis TaxID=1914755 RepID=A0A853C724_9ACTN|nr:NAD(P)-binding oxidoreductase [Nocardioides thalensis]NYJ02278.1 uncharacterized protein YbjT (DUF2867 family) [Nocardioides thalensis]